MEKDKETEKLFVGRFIDLWLCFNPGKFIGPDIRNVGIRYYNILSAEGVDFNTFDRICNSVEKDFSSLGYDFNLAAYVMDCIRAERLEKSNIKFSSFNRPAEIPAEGLELFSNKPEMQKAIETLKKNRVNSFSIVIQKLNAIREQGKKLEYQYKCYACMDTGFISLSVYFDAEDRRRKVKIHEPEDFGCIQVVKRCTCHEGQKVSSNVIHASKKECIESARIHGGQFQESSDRQFAEAVPF